MIDGGKRFGPSRREWPDWSPPTDEEWRKILRNHTRRVRQETVPGLKRHLARVRLWAEDQAKQAPDDRRRGPFLESLENARMAEKILGQLAGKLEDFSSGKPVDAESLNRCLSDLSKCLEKGGIRPERAGTAVEVDAQKLEAGVKEVIKYLRQTKGSGLRAKAGARASNV